MDKKIIAGVLLVVLGFVAVLNVPLSLAQEDVANLDGDNGKGGLWRRFHAWRIINYILKNGEPVSLSGDVVVLERHILVLDLGSDYENIVIPGRWLVEGQVLSLREFYDNYLSNNEADFVSLMLEYEQDDKIVKLYFSYKIIVDDITCEAILPFNIEAK